MNVFTNSPNFKYKARIYLFFKHWVMCGILCFANINSSKAQCAQSTLACKDNVILTLPCLDASCTVELTLEDALEFYDDNCSFELAPAWNAGIEDLVFDITDIGQSYIFTAMLNDMGNTITCWGYVSVQYPNESDCFALSASHEKTLDEQVAVQISTTGFRNIHEARFSIEWDTEVLDFLDVIPNYSFDLNHFDFSETDLGKLTVNWTSQNLNGSTISNYGNLFALNFNTVGASGEHSEINININQNGQEILISDGQRLPFAAFNGSVILETADDEVPLNILEGCATPHNCAAQDAINLTVLGGNPPYDFTWSGPNGFAAFTEDLTGLATGFYQVTVNDISGQTATGQVEVAEMGLPNFEVEFSRNSATCATASDGSIAVTNIQYGQVPFTFNWSNGSTDSVATGLSPDLYAVTITDANACSQVFQYQLYNYGIHFLGDYQLTTPDCNGVPNGSIDLQFPNHLDSTNYLVSWNNGMMGDSIFGIASGLYQVTLTDTVQGCVYQDSVRLNELDDGKFFFDDIVNSCFDNYLIGRYQPNNGDTTLSLTWNTGDSTFFAAPSAPNWFMDTLFNQPPDFYQLTATNADGCTATSEWKRLICNSNPNLTSCLKLEMQEANAIPSSQVCVPIRYSGSLVNGNYLLFEEVSYTLEWEETMLAFSHIQYPDAPQITFTEDEDFSLTNIADGQLGYHWNGYSTLVDEVFIHNLRYEVCFDVLGDWDDASAIWFSESVQPFLFKTSDFEIVNFNTENGRVVVSTETIEEVNFENCIDFSNCQHVNFDLSVADSVQVIWTGANGFVSNEINLTGVEAGNYHLLVTDLDGNYLTEGDVWLNFEEPIEVASGVFRAACGIGENIRLNVTGGSGQYDFLWSNGATTEDLDSLNIGTYTVTISDIAGCVGDYVETFNLTGTSVGFSNISIETACSLNGTNNGFAAVDIYHNSPFELEHFYFSDLAGGPNVVQFEDSEGCPYEIVIDIPTTAFGIEFEQSYCNEIGDTTAFIDLTVTGDASQASFLWNNEDVGLDLINVPPGYYSLSVFDTTTYCEFYFPIELGGNSLSITHADVFCESSLQNDGKILLDVTGNSPISYEWNTGHTERDYENLPAGNYQVTITDDSGCQIVESFEVGSTNLEITEVEIGCAFEGGKGGVVDIEVAGGNPPLTYNWFTTTSPASANQQDLTNTSGGYKRVYIQESTGCTIQSDSFYVCEIPAPPPNCIHFDIGQAVGNVGDTVCVPVQVRNFNNIIGFQHSLSYDATVLHPINVQNFDLEYLDDSFFNLNSGGQNSGKISAAWYDDDAVGKSRPDNTSIYEICFEIVEDSNGFSLIEVSDQPTVIEIHNNFELPETLHGIPGMVTIENTVTPSLQIFSGCLQPVVCSDTNPVSQLEIYPKGGNPPYTYLWDGPNNFTSVQKDLNNIVAGDYFVTVTDFVGNMAMDAFEISTLGESDLIDTLITTLNICPDESTITVVPIDQLMPLNYLWHNNQATPTITATNAAINTVTVTDENGCTSVDSLFFDETLDLNLTATPDCTPDFGKTYTLHTTLPEGGLLNVIWSDGVTIATNNEETTREDVPPGTYFATVSNSAGCIINTDTLELPGIVAISPDTLVCGATAVPLSVTTIGSLDSYEWSPATGLSCLDCPNPTALPQMSTTYTLTAHFANDTCAEVRQFFVAVDDECVWPGDANYNDIANHFDLLPIGLGYDETGPIRPNATTNWQAEPAFPYANQTPQSLVNYKHADTDGNGWIDANDTLAIVLNWDETHNLWGVDDKFWEGGSLSNSVFTPDFYIEQDTAYEGEGVALKIMLGTEENPAEDVYGLAFSVSFDENIVAPGSAKVSFETSWLGDITDDMIAVQRQYVLNGHVNVGVTRIDHENRTGFGQIGTCYIVIEDNIFEPPLLGDEKSGEATEMDLLVLRGVIIDNEENELIAFYPSSQLIILEQPTSVFETELAQQISLFPNPVQAELTLNSPYLKMQQLTIFDWSGQMMQQTVIDDFSKNIDVERLAAGAYFIKIQTAEGFVFKRFVKE